MPNVRRCHVCNHILDPLLDECILLLKGVGSEVKSLKRVLWLCPKHGVAYERVLHQARQEKLRPDKYGKITVTSDA